MVRLDGEKRSIVPSPWENMYILDQAKDINTVTYFEGAFRLFARKSNLSSICWGKTEFSMAT